MRNTFGAATSNDQILIPVLGPNVLYSAAERRFGRCLKTIAVRAAALLIFLLVSAGAARAQSLYGSIRGTVTDTSGGVIPDVMVTATNIATGVIQQVKTHADGTYAFLQLPIGDYSVKAAKDGFQSFNAN